MKLPTLLIAVALALCSGCQTLTPSTPAYKLANQARLKAVTPWLNTYATDHPTDAQKVNDVLNSWRSEVDAQQRTVTPAPVQP